MCRVSGVTPSCAVQETRVIHTHRHSRTLERRHSHTHTRTRAMCALHALQKAFAPMSEHGVVHVREMDAPLAYARLYHRPPPARYL